MINSLLITNNNGNIVFSKYYSNINDEKQSEYEKLLYQFTKDEWVNSKNEKHLVTEFSGYITVFTNVGDLMLFLCGSEEMDELAYSLKDICKKKGVTEQNFIEQIPKFILYLDEIIQRGHLDQVQLESIQNYSSLKHDQPIKKDNV
ncbi:hypothetical protein ACTFIZ_008243 [Dictyostelium cf. discoideum]